MELRALLKVLDLASTNLSRTAVLGNPLNLDSATVPNAYLYRVRPSLPKTCSCVMSRTLWASWFRT